MSHGLRYLSNALVGPPIRNFNFASTSSSRIFPKKRKRSLCKYSTSAIRSSLESILDNSKPNQKETIEAVFVFHRHGDRTPGSSLVADDQANDESEFWKTKIPPSTLYESLSKRFPAVHQDNKINNKYHSSYDSFRESSGGNKSYGFLTWKGLHQMYHQGSSVARKYTPNHGSFSDGWDIRALSTNYLRTVMSCQAFLDGLLSNNTRIDSTPLDYAYPTHYEENLPLPTSDSSKSIEILVRDAENETLNAFQSSPTLMKEYVRQVFATLEFMAKDQKHKPLKLELDEYLPGLSKNSTYGGTSSQSGDIRINWIDAADHFVCRSSHSVPPQQFCPHLTGNTLDEQKRFTQLGRQTLSHLQQRFHSYYSHPQLLAEMAGPALHEMVMEMKDACNGSDDKKPFRIFSCHDVTILALLYAIQGLSLETTQLPPLWPTYATCLAFELVRLEDGDSFVVRAWLSGAPIPEFVPSPVLFQGSADHQPYFSIDIAAFEVLVKDVNEKRSRRALASDE